MGSVVISVDAELGWGFHDLDSPPADRLDACRSGWRRLLGLLEEFDVPATWAVVGHLFLDACDGRHGDHPAPDGWFDRERGENALPRDLRFGRGLVDAIGDADAAHEIGAHSFSHVEFGDADTTSELARAEVAENLDAAATRGVVPTSFVFPRNAVGHRDVLAAYGFTCYRGRVPDREGGSSLLGSARKLARGTVLDATPPLVTPSIDEYGLVNVPASLYLFEFEGLARSLVEPVFGDPIVGWARNGIDRAATDDGVFHLWLHPNNVVEERDADRLWTILDHVDRRREGSGLRVETMGDVAERVLADPAASTAESVQ